MTEPKLSSNAHAVLARRYLARDAQGEVCESPRELFERVAAAVASGEEIYGANEVVRARWAERFYELMASLRWLPNSPTLMNAGRPLGQLSACFVLPIDDSLEEIFETVKQAALIHQSGGGTGFSFSRLRPAGSRVRSTHGVASGPISFMSVFNAATEAVKQGGTRRGANMGILRVDHPDIVTFIQAKSENQAVTNFNISVGLTDEFMAALASGGTLPLRNPRDLSPYRQSGSVVEVNASDLFSLIVREAWSTGEPGVIFLDRMNEANPTYPHEVIEATNPCGEQPLPAYDSCNLGSLNLGMYSTEGVIDYDLLRSDIHLAVRFLDNVIDVNRYPLPEIEAQTKLNRRIGLGVMGWADCLVDLGLPYDSLQAQDLGQSLAAFIRTESEAASRHLAEERGTFPNWHFSTWGRSDQPMRNATVTTVAPTGTISILADCSHGIEPYYALAYERHVMDGTRLRETVGRFRTALSAVGIDPDSIAVELAGRRTVRDMTHLPSELRELFGTAADIAPADHVRMQAVWQQSVDAAVSKTINLPETATVADVDETFRLAYELGCKGVTVYRDNSRPDQVLAVPEPEAETNPIECIDC